MSRLFAMPNVKRWIAIVAAAAVVAVPLAVVGQPQSAQAAPGDEVMSIEWEAGAANQLTLIQNYTSLYGGTFRADAPWLNNSTTNYGGYTGNCNGIVVSYDMPVNSSWNGTNFSQRFVAPSCGKQAVPSNGNTSLDYSSINILRGVAGAMGRFDAELEGRTLPNNQNTNSVLATFTDGNSQAAGVMAEMLTPYTVSTGGYIVASVDVGVANCTNPPSIMIQYATESSNFANLLSSAVNPCSPPASGSVSRTYSVPSLDPSSGWGGNVNVTRLYSTTSVVAGANTNDWRLRVVNNQANFVGNDGAIDNIRLYDATPTISKAFVAGVNTNGDTSALTFTITNSDDLASKNDFYFTDALASGLTPVPGSAVTTCGNGTVALTGNTVALTGGDLASGAASCTVTLRVSGTSNTFTNGASNITSTNLLPPATPATVSFAAPTDRPETVTTPYQTAVTLNPLANFAPVAGDTTPTTATTAGFRFEPLAGTTIAADGRTATNSSGTFVYNPTTGAVIFTPASGFVGVTPAMPYSYTDSNGNRVSSTMTVTVAGQPVAGSSSVSATEGTAVQFNTVALSQPGTNGAPLAPSSVRFIDPVTGAASTGPITVAGQGTWTVNATTGVVTFTPVAGFTGTATPIRYTIADTSGVRSTPGTLQVSYPNVNDVVGSANQGSPATVAPSLDPGMVAGSVRFVGAGGAPVTSIVVAGQGTWSVDTTTGAMTFTPIAGFEGSPTPVQYTATDASGVRSNPATVTVTYPNVSNVSGAGTQGQPVTVAAALDPGTLASTVRIVAPDGTYVTSLAVPGQGTWSVNATSGALTFTPVAGFQGVPTPINYVASNAAGSRSLPATVTVSYPDVSDVSGAGNQGQPVAVAPVLGAGTSPSSVRLIAPDGSRVTTLTVPGEGTWGVNPTTGAMTFTPAAGFQGNPTPVNYTATDSAGNAAAPASVTIRYPDVSNVVGSGAQGSPITVAPIVDADTVASSVRLVAPDGTFVTSLTVAGQGTWAVNTSTGAMTFTPDSGFQGVPSPVQYVGYDATGNRSLPASVTLTYPDVSDVSATGNQGSAVNIAPVLGSGTVASTVRFIAADGSRVPSLTVPGEGVWTVNATTGVMTFTPAAGFQGDPTPVRYSAADAAGNLATPASVTVNYPDVSAITGSGDQGAPVTIAPVVDEDTVAATTQLVAANGSLVSTLVVAGEGTWSVDSGTGAITFTPAPGFLGSPTPVRYTALDASGNRATPETVTVAYPNVADVAASGDQGSAVSVAPLVSAGTIANTTQFVGADGSLVGDLTVAGEGRWTIDSATGVMTFTPEVGFQGDPAPVRYTALDAAGNQAEPATVTVRYPDIRDVADTGDQGQSATVTPDLEAGVLASTVQFVAADGSLVSTLTVAGEGAWTIDATTGVMTFTPADGFQGDPTPVQYTAFDGSGNQALAATATITYPDVSDVVGSGSQGQPVTVMPVVDAQAIASTVQFVGAGGALTSTLVVTGEGTWSIDPANGAMTFTPAPGFQGMPSTVQYVAFDADGNVAEPANVLITYPDIDDVAATGDQGAAVRVAPALGEAMDPASVQFVSEDGTLVSTLTVAGEGTWTVGEATGIMTFTPEPGFQGDPTPVNYVARDANGNLAESATVTVLYPDVRPVTGAGAQGASVTVPTDLDAQSLPTTVQLVDPTTGELVDEAVVPGQGTWTVDPETGAVTFAPIAGFVEDPTPIGYVAFDADGNQSLQALVTVTYPDVSDVTGSGDQGTAVTVNPSVEPGTDPTTTRFVAADGSPVTELVVDGEGTWTIDQATGAMTFTPAPGFQGNPTPVEYTAADADGNRAAPGTVTITYPDVSAITGAGAQGSAVTISPSVDDDADPTTVQLIGADGALTTSLTVPGEGTWSVDPGTGAITFTPLPEFTGDPTPIEYTAFDADGNQAEPAPVIVSYPDIDDVSGSGDQGSPVTVSPILGQAADPTTVRLIDPTTGTQVSQIAVPGEGIWTVDPATGDITFTPDTGFQGDPAPVQYIASDANGNPSQPATVSVTYPDIEDVAGSGDQGSAVTVPVALEDGVVATTVQLLDASGAPVTELTVAGEGTWTVDPATGAVTFAPEPGFQGPPTPVEYIASDAEGNQALPATVTVTYPDVSDVRGTGDQGESITVQPALGSGMDATTVRFVATDGSLVSTLTVPGEGTWTIDPVSGAMTFTPDAGFQGSPAAVQYTAQDSLGNQATPATVSVSYPNVDDIVGSGDQGTAVTVTPDLVEGIDPSTVRFLDPETGEPVAEVVVAGEGVWSVDPGTGAMTFTPELGFQGDPTPIEYSALDTDGNLANSALVTITYPDVDPVAGAGDEGQPVTVEPVLEAGTLATTVQFVSETGALSSTLVVAGEGTWTIDATTGAMTFAPLAGFVGDPTPVNYTAFDGGGNQALPASVTITYPNVADIAGDGDQGRPVTIDTVRDAGLAPETVRLIDPATGTQALEVVVEGEGRWSVDVATGAITFTPDAGFQGDPTAITYTAADANGNVALPASVTVTYPDVSDAAAAGDQGDPVTVEPVLEAGMDATTVQFVLPDGSLASTIDVPGEGTWTIDPETGAMTFTPAPGFQADPAPVQYTALDAAGNRALPATVTVTYPNIDDVRGSGDQGAAVTLLPVLDDGMDPTSVRLIDPLSGAAVTEVVVAGEGTWSVDVTTGAITFTPDAGFQGDPTPIEFTAADVDGNLSEPATASVHYPDVGDVVASGVQGQPVTIRAVFDEDTLPTTIEIALVDGDGNYTTEIVVPGEGTWTVSASTGSITFTPEPGFQGVPSAVQYVGYDAEGNVSQPASVTVSYPDVDNIAATGDQGQAVTITPVVGATTDPSTVQLIAPDGSNVSELVVAGQGTWTVDPSNGAITFTPIAGFQGDPTPIEYTAADGSGNLAEPATVTVNYPDVSPIAGTADQGSAVSIEPIVDEDTDATTVQLVAADGSLATELVVAGEGTWTVDAATGTITFTPNADFFGNPTPIAYTAFDADGNQAEPASVTISFPNVADVAGNGDQGSPVTVAPLVSAGTDPTTVMFVAADGSLVNSLVVDGEGTWTLDPATGSMTFAPEAGFQGDPTPVQYTAFDADGNQAQPASVTVVYPDVSDVVAAGAQGQPVTVAPVLEAGMDATTVQFVTADGSLASTLTVPGEGTWTVEAATGNMTFTPNSTFAGDPSPVRYTALDANGNEALPATVTITVPDVNDIAGTGDQGQPVTIAPSLEAGMDPATVQLVAADGSLVNELVVAGEGTWTVGTDGAITFAPVADFQGDPTPVQYTATDAAGNLALPASVTVDYPDVADVAGNGDQGSAVTVPTALDEDAVATTVQLIAPDSSLVSELVVDGEGTWSVDPTNGAITFTPVDGFLGEPAPVQYTALDADGNQALPASVTVTYPNITDVSGTGDQGQPVTVAAGLDAGMDPATVQFVAADGSFVTELVVAGEGTWTVNPVTGAITFTPEEGFQGDPAPVQYTALDVDGNRAAAATATILYPDVSDITGAGDQGAAITVTPVTDAQTLPGSTQLVGADGTLVSVLDVAGEGVWSVDAAGAITFTPEADFQGDPTPISYVGFDADGNQSQPASITLNYPDVADVFGGTSQGDSITVDAVLDEDAVPSTVVFVAPDGALVTELVVAGEGTWTVDPATGAMTFTPAEGFQGDPAPVQYTALDAEGNQAEPATVTLDFPNVSDVAGTGNQGEPVTIAPALDEGMDATSVQFVDPDGELVSELVVAGEGTWTIDPATGAMTFTPETGFQGDPTPVQYTAFDANGSQALPASVTVQYPDVSDVTAAGEQGAPVTIDVVVDEDTLVTSVQLLDADGAFVSTLEVAGEGSWSVDPTTGAITFTPVDGFQGDPAPVQYVGFDSDGNVSEPATVRIGFPDVADVFGTGDQGVAVTVAPALDDSTLATTVMFVTADGSLANELDVDGEGTWTINAVSGAMTFTPEPGFQGDPTPVQYTASDAAGNQAVPGSVTVNYPDASDISVTADQDTIVSVMPILDEDAIATTVQLIAPDGTVVNELSVIGQGNWFVDAATGTISFEPIAGFSGDPTPVQYVAFDADGNKSEPATVTINYPNVSDITGASAQGQPVTIPVVVDEDTLVSTVQLVDAAGNLSSTLEVPGEGTWTVDAVTGAITFTPEPGFQGDPAPTKYTAFDADGNMATPANVTVGYPDVSDVTGAGDQGQPVSVSPVLNNGTDATTVVFVTADGATVTELVVAGEGVWTVDPTTGVMTFTPESGFQGDPTPVEYTALDADGNQAEPASVTIDYPDVNDIARTGVQGQPVTIAAAYDEDVVPSTVQLVAADGSFQTSLTVAGEGIWSVNPENGSITFTPEVGFQGVPTPIQYVGFDADGNVSEPATATVTYPDVADVASTGDQGQPVTVAPELGVGTDPATVVFVAPDGSFVTELVVAGEGTWTVDAVTGAMTFTPEPGFQGDPTPVQYTALDADGNSAQAASVSVDYPDVSDIAETGSQGSAVTLLPVVDEDVDPASVRLVAADGTFVAELVVDGEGTWSVDTATGAMTFTPIDGFAGDPTVVQYVGFDADGNVSEPASVTVNYPDVADVFGTGDQGQPVTVEPVLDEDADPATVQFVAADGSLASALNVAGEGVWTIDPVTGAMTFTPEAGFQGDPTPVQYTARDAAGNLAEAATVTVDYPDVADVAGSGAQGTPVTVEVALDEDTLPTTVQLVGADGALVSALVVDGEGSWTVDPATGAITFTPEPGFQGTPTAVEYVGFDADGNQSLPASVTVTFPDVADVVGAANQGEAAVVQPQLGEGVDATTVQFVAADGSLVSELAVPGEGTWTIDPVTGAMTFTPEAGFQGDPTPVDYTAFDAAGNQAEPASVTVDYPDVADVVGAGSQGEAVTVAAALDEDTLPTTVQLVATDGAFVTELVVAGEGTWTVDSTTGAITFTPEAGFQGVPAPVQYVGFDAAGNRSEPATVTVTFPDVSDVAARADQGQPVTVEPALGAGVDASTVVFIAPDGSLVTTLDVPGEGSWSVDPATGAMTFTPVVGFQGDPTPVMYTAFDGDGNQADPASVTVDYPDVSDAVGAGAQGQPVTVPVVLDEDTLPTTVQLVGADGALVSQVVVAGEGSWTVDATTGAITFTPEVGFQGTPTPIKYVGFDQDGNVSQPAIVSVTYPDVDDIAGAGDQGQPVAVDPVLGTGVDPATVVLIASDGSLVTELVVAGEGTWSVDPATGAITFTPEPGFQGDPTPVQYSARDAAGNLAEPATVAVDYPDVADVARSGQQGEPVTVPTSLDDDVDPTTLQIVGADGALVSELVVVGEGTWTVDPETGAITFTPEEGFDGNPAPIQYVGFDADGNVSQPATVSVSYPDVVDLFGAADQGQPVVVEPVFGADLDPATVVLVAGDGSLVTELVVAGEGTWTVDPSTGAITFTPEAGFQGDPTPVQYTARDADGNLAEPGLVTVDYPDVSDVVSSGAQGQPVTVSPIVDEDVDPATVQFVAADGTLVTELVVDGEGTWTVDPVTGDMTFTPEDGFSGSPTPVEYVGFDGEGNRSEPATVTVSVPDVTDVAGAGDQGQPVTIAAGIGAGIDPTSVVLIDPATGAAVTQLVVDGEGTWTVDPVTGAMTFTPEPGFQGSPTPVQYTARDLDGNLAEPATVSVSYPDVAAIAGNGPVGSPVTVPVAIDESVDPTTIVIIDPTTGAEVTELEVPGEGTWTVDPETGAITFTPEPGFEGNPTPVEYTGYDAGGNRAEPATVEIEFTPVTQPSDGSEDEVTPFQTPIDIDPFANFVPGDSGAEPDPATFRFLPGDDVEVSEDGLTATLPSGVYVYDPETGLVTFTPNDGFAGITAFVPYTFNDTSGAAVASTMRVRVAAPVLPGETTAPPTAGPTEPGVTPTAPGVLPTPTATPTYPIPGLPVTGAELGFTIPALAMLLMGLGIFLASRRKRAEKH